VQPVQRERVPCQRRAASLQREKAAYSTGTRTIAAGAAAQRRGEEARARRAASQENAKPVRLPSRRFFALVRQTFTVWRGATQDRRSQQAAAGIPAEGNAGRTDPSVHRSATARRPVPPDAIGLMLPRRRCRHTIIPRQAGYLEPRHERNGIWQRDSRNGGMREAPGQQKER